MFFKFSAENFQDEAVTFEVFLGNQLIHKQQISAPRIMIESMFMEYVQQLAARNDPMHLKMTGQFEFWDEFENCMRVLPKSIDYWNYNYQENE